MKSKSFVLSLLCLSSHIIYSMQDDQHNLLSYRVAEAIAYKLHCKLFYYHENSGCYKKDIDDLKFIVFTENIILTRMGYDREQNIIIDSLSLSMNNLIQSECINSRLYETSELYKDYDKGYQENA